MSARSQRQKAEARERRKYRIRKKITGSNVLPRVSVFRSSKYTYAQVISDTDGSTLASASTKLSGDLKEVLDSSGTSNESDHSGADSHNDSRTSKSVAAAHALGVVLGRSLLKKNVNRVVFDRNGFIYTGRVRAVADGLRTAGVTV